MSEMACLSWVVLVAWQVARDGSGTGVVTALGEKR